MKDHFTNTIRDKKIEEDKKKQKDSMDQSIRAMFNTKRVSVDLIDRVDKASKESTESIRSKVDSNFNTLNS